MKYKHDDNTIDPRDTNLISYNPKSKKFVTEASSIQAAGIQPHSHHYTIGRSKYVIYMWSPKYRLHITYVWNHSVKSPDGEIIADVFVPKFDMIVTMNEHLAHDSSLGTELHILND
jgi:hypothetical protein